MVVRLWLNDHKRQKAILNKKAGKAVQKHLQDLRGKYSMRNTEWLVTAQ